MPSAIEASNAMTARWAATCGGGSTVLSGLGVWPLVALLSAAATGPAADELRAAAGLDNPAEAVDELLGKLESNPATHAALGLWTHRDLPLQQEWLATLPTATHEILSGDPAADKAHLDAWAAKQTDQLIKHMPVRLSAEVRLVLASALAVRTTWITPFRVGRHTAESGPWTGRPFASLYRQTGDPDQADLVNGLTRVRVAGSDDIEVHLLLGGPDPGTVLPAGIAALTGTPDSTGSQWQPGFSAPGIEVSRTMAVSRPSIRITTTGFSVNGSHDLLAHDEVFGLRTARDASHGHFPAISPEPLAIGQARQDAMAIFSATGFEAAAVTAIGMRTAAAMRTNGSTLVSVTFDRPFGFLAVHRPTGLVLVAGWVTEPARDQDAG